MPTPRVEIRAPRLNGSRPSSPVFISPPGELDRLERCRPIHPSIIAAWRSSVRWAWVSIAFVAIAAANSGIAALGLVHSAWPAWVHPTLLVVWLITMAANVRTLRSVARARRTAVLNRISEGVTPAERRALLGRAPR